MGSRRDLVGSRFGRLTVVAETTERRHANVVWECRCDCGATAQVPTTALTSGRTASCGCLQSDRASETFTTHGRSRSPEYRMLHRAQTRAGNKGLPFAISLDDIHVPERCPVLGIRIGQGNTIMKDDSPALDRLRPSMGYVPGNVIVMSMLANRIKGSANSEQVLAVADWMESLGL